MRALVLPVALAVLLAGCTVPEADEPDAADDAPPASTDDAEPCARLDVNVTRPGDVVLVLAGVQNCGRVPVRLDPVACAGALAVTLRHENGTEWQLTPESRTASGNALPRCVSPTGSSVDVAPAGREGTLVSWDLTVARTHCEYGASGHPVTVTCRDRAVDAPPGAYCVTVKATPRDGEELVAHRVIHVGGATSDVYPCDEDLPRPTVTLAGGWRVTVDRKPSGQAGLTSFVVDVTSTANATGSPVLRAGAWTRFIDGSAVRALEEDGGRSAHVDVLTAAGPPALTLHVGNESFPIRFPPPSPAFAFPPVDTHVTQYGEPPEHYREEPRVRVEDRVRRVLLSQWVNATDRCVHAEHAFGPPNGNTIPLTAFVTLRPGCEGARVAWVEATTPPLPMSSNVTVRTLVSDALVSGWNVTWERSVIVPPPANSTEPTEWT